MKLLIKESCIVEKGKTAERGDVIESSDERVTYALISSGRALVETTAEAKVEAATIVEEKRNVKAKK